MQFVIVINQSQAIELGVENLSEGHIFDLLTKAAAWADPIIHNNEVFYWVARQKIRNELPILNISDDRIYRYLKSLDEKGLIKYEKKGKKDLIQITKKGKKYVSRDYVGENTEKVYVGENTELGKNTEKNSVNLPTYQDTIPYPSLEEEDEDINDFIFFLKNKGKKIKDEIAFYIHIKNNLSSNDSKTIDNYKIYRNEKHKKIMNLIDYENETLNINSKKFNIYGFLFICKESFYKVGIKSTSSDLLIVKIHSDDDKEVIKWINKHITK